MLLLESSPCLSLRCPIYQTAPQADSMWWFVDELLNVLLKLNKLIFFQEIPKAYGSSMFILFFESLKYFVTSPIQGPVVSKFSIKCLYSQLASTTSVFLTRISSTKGTSGVIKFGQNRLLRQALGSSLVLLLLISRCPRGVCWVVCLTEK